MSRPFPVSRISPSRVTLPIALVSVGAVGGWLTRDVQSLDSQESRVRPAHRTPTATYSSSTTPPIQTSEKDHAPDKASGSPEEPPPFDSTTKAEPDLVPEAEGESLAQRWARLEAAYQALQAKSTLDSNLDAKEDAPVQPRQDEEPGPERQTDVLATHSATDSVAEGSSDPLGNEDARTEQHDEPDHQLAGLKLHVSPETETASKNLKSQPRQVLVRYAPIVMLPFSGASTEAGSQASTEAESGHFVGERSPLSGVTYFGTNGRRGPRNPWAPIDMKGRNNPWGPTTLGD